MMDHYDTGSVRLLYLVYNETCDLTALVYFVF